jgi:hypothetical protein
MKKSPLEFLTAIQQRLTSRISAWKPRLISVALKVALASVGLAIILSVIIAWIHFKPSISQARLSVWTDIILGTTALAIVPLLLAAYGGHLAAEMIENPIKRRKAKLIFWGLCLVGVSLAFLQQFRAVNSDVSNQSKTDGVEAHIVTLLEDLHGPGTITEADRRHKILQALQQRYILTNEVSQRVIDGLEPPPADWINEQLKELGENWTVAEDKPQATVAQTHPQRSYVDFVGNPAFTGSESTTEGGQFKVGDPISFNVHYTATGPNPVQLVEAQRILLLEPDVSLDTEKAAISFFINEVDVLRKAGTIKPQIHTMQKGDNEFFTVFAWTGLIDRADLYRVVTQDDLDKLKNGSEYALLMVVIAYKDLGVVHHLRRCMWLQSPAKPPGIWHFCQTFPDSD